MPHNYVPYAPHPGHQQAQSKPAASGRVETPRRPLTVSFAVGTRGGTGALSPRPWKRNLSPRELEPLVRPPSVWQVDPRDPSQPWPKAWADPSVPKPPAMPRAAAVYSPRAKRLDEEGMYSPPSTPQLMSLWQEAGGRFWLPSRGVDTASGGALWVM